LKRIVVVVLIVLLVLGLLVGAGGYAAYRMGNFKPQPTKVRIEKAAPGQLIEVVSAPGTVQPETKVQISARVSARITELPFKEGQLVKKGDVVVRLDAEEIEGQLKAAEARLRGQQAEIVTAQARIVASEKGIGVLDVQLDNARKELKRQVTLFESNDIALSQLEAAQLAVDQLVARLASDKANIDADKKAIATRQAEAEALEAEIGRVRNSLSYTTILSPIDGIITKLNSEVGETTTAGSIGNAGTSILDIADLGTMLVEARVDETDIPAVKVGQTVDVRIQAFPDKVFKGTVQTVGLALSERASDRTSFYATKILLDKEGMNIVSGLTADVEIQTNSTAGVLRVPSQAVLARSVDDLPPDIRASELVDKTRTFTTVVYRKVNGKSVVTPVKTGPSDITHTSIVAGLTEGDAIIVGPFKVLENLRHDTTIEEESAATTKPAK
jgi:HlyD family secretion protein